MDEYGTQGATRAVETDTGKALNLETLLKERDLEQVAETLLEDSFRNTDIMKKDSLDRFLDLAHFKAQTGLPEILHMAYPTKRMMDRELEKRVVELINTHLYPEIILKLLKYFTRNIHDADTNLYLANLVHSEDIIRSIYETFVLFKKDIFVSDPERRTINVKRVQQFSPRTDNKTASPLDAASRLKYILEFIALKQDVSHIYRAENLRMSADEADAGKQ